MKNVKELIEGTDSIGKINFENEVESQQHNFYNFYTTSVTAIAEGMLKIISKIQY